MVRRLILEGHKVADPSIPQTLTAYDGNYSVLIVIRIAAESSFPPPREGPR